MFAAAFYALFGYYPSAGIIQMLRIIAASGLSVEQIEQNIIALQNDVMEGRLAGVSPELARYLRALPRRQSERRPQTRSFSGVGHRLRDGVITNEQRERERAEGLDRLARRMGGRAPLKEQQRPREQPKPKPPVVQQPRPSANSRTNIRTLSDLRSNGDESQGNSQPSGSNPPLFLVLRLREPERQEQQPPPRQVVQDALQQPREEVINAPRVDVVPAPRVEPRIEAPLSQYQLEQRERLRQERLKREADEQQRVVNRDDALRTIDYYLGIINRLLLGKLTEDQRRILLRLKHKLYKLYEPIYNKGVGSEDAVQEIKDYVIKFASQQISAALRVAPSSDLTGGDDGVWTGAINEILLTNWILEHDTHGMSASNAQQVARGIIAHNGKTSGGGTNFKYQGRTVFHISHGKMGKTDGCTVFFVVTENGVIIVGIGAHQGSSSYRLDWKLDGWCQGSSIDLSK
jgi:hypothetical protein